MSIRETDDQCRYRHSAFSKLQLEAQRLRTTINVGTDILHFHKCELKLTLENGDDNECRD